MSFTSNTSFTSKLKNAIRGIKREEPGKEDGQQQVTWAEAFEAMATAPRHPQHVDPPTHTRVAYFPVANTSQQQPHHHHHHHQQQQQQQQHYQQQPIPSFPQRHDPPRRAYVPPPPGITPFRQGQGVPQPSPSPPPETQALHFALRAYFERNAPECLPRLAKIERFAMENGINNLTQLLKEEFGAELDQVIVVDAREMEIRAHALAQQLVGFYQAHPTTAGSKTLEEIQRVANWGARHGEIALNAKLWDTYMDDLDSYSLRIAHKLEPKLRAFYKKIKPELLDRGLGPLLKWTVANGEIALNDLLFSRYGVDLTGRGTVTATRKKEIPGRSARALMHSQLMLSPTLSSKVTSDLAKAAQHDKEIRKELLITQLAAFLQIHDPKRLHENGGEFFLSLVDWALSRTDREVDDLLLELYMHDLTTTNLRHLSFSDAHELTQDVPVESMARVSRAVSSASETDFSTGYVAGSKDDPEF